MRRQTNERTAISASDLQEVRFTSILSDWLRYDKYTLETLRTTEPYRALFAMTMGKICVRLPMPIPLEEQSDIYTDHVVSMPKQMLERLGHYATLFFTDPNRYDTGNCYDFTTFMLGYNAWDRIEATRVINDQLPYANVLSDTSEPSAGVGLIIGHPAHALSSPLGICDAEYALPPAGHGALQILHSSVSIGMQEDGTSWVLQRAAMGGALSIGPYRSWLPTYSAMPERVPLDWWKDRRRPDPADLQLYQIAQLAI